MPNKPSDESRDEPLSQLTGPSINGAVGHVVVERGQDSTGADAIGVWHLVPTGQPVGAWITTLDTLGANKAAAQRVLELLERRSLLCWNPGAPCDIVNRVATLAAASPPRGWEAAAVRLPEALVEIAEHRARHAQALSDHCSATKSKTTPLVWRREVPADPATLEQLQRVARVVGTIGTNQVAQRALLLSRLTRWVVELWHDTEQVRGRRQYLRDQFGHQAPLPPRWLGQLRAAYATMGR